MMRYVKSSVVVPLHHYYPGYSRRVDDGEGDVADVVVGGDETPSHHHLIQQTHSALDTLVLDFDYRWGGTYVVVSVTSTVVDVLVTFLSC